MKLFSCNQTIRVILLILMISIPVNIQANTGTGNQFKHQYLTLDLPAGWKTYPAPDGSPKESIGVLKSDKIAGASITLECYRGAFHSHASTRIRALNTISAVYPAGQKQLKKPYRVKAKGGKGNAELWRGYIKVGDLMVSLISPMAELKTKHCWLVMIGFAPETATAAIEKDFLAILKSAR